VTGSWIGRSLLAVPALLASVGMGIVLVGLTGSVTLGSLTSAVLAAIAAARAARTGVTIDLDREQVVLLTFWRTYRVDASALERVDAPPRGADGPWGVRFRLRDGREFGSLALAFLQGRPADALVADLGTLTSAAPFEVALTPASFRRAVG
jgi:hypothetical protein